MADGNQIPYWIDDPLIDRSAHRLIIGAPDEENHPHGSASCSCGGWQAPGGWDIHAQEEGFDDHMEAVQIAARRFPIVLAGEIEAVVVADVHRLTHPAAPAQNLLTGAPTPMAVPAPDKFAADMLAVLRDVATGLRVLDEDLVASANSLVAEAGRVFGAAERRNLVAWLHAQSVELAAGRPDFTEQQRLTLGETSRALIRTIAHLLASGMAGQELEL